MYSIAIALVIAGIAATYYTNRHSVIGGPHRYQNCSVLGQNVLYGPEDMTISHTHQLLFVSSHDRRTPTIAGGIFAVNVSSNAIIPLPVSTPTIFRPHGIAIYEADARTRLYVISHSTDADPHNPLHVIEVFDFDITSMSLRYVKTLRHSLLSSPNDLFALGLDELLISNDHGPGSALQNLMDDILKKPRAQLVYYRSKLDVDIWYGTAIYAAFGNGLIALKEADGTHVYHATSVDYKLTKYHLHYTDNDDMPILLQHLYTDTLPVSPDNIEYDISTKSLIIGAHVSTWQFMAHAVLRTISPSAVLQYNGYMNYTVLYHDFGMQLSGSSVGVQHWMPDNTSKLYIGQVFDPFILACT